VYARVPLHLLAGADPADLLAVELEVERDLLIPDLDIAELLRTAGERGLRTVVVSDTYFTEAHVRAFLDQPPLAGLRLDGVFVSSAWGAGKGTGLFPIVLRELGADAGSVVHVGDHPVSDVEAPRSLGLRTVDFERRPAGLTEVIYREHAHVSRTVIGEDGDFGLTALRSKVWHRSALGALPDELHPFWRYGATSLGPVLTGFGEWVVARTEEVGSSTAMCMMREGAVLAELVNNAAAYLGSGVRAEPIWLSRQVCARAAIRSGSREELSRLLSRRKAPALREFCATLGVDVEELPGFRSRAEARLNDDVLADELLDALSSDADRRGRILDGARTQRERLLRYVEKVMPAGDPRLVLVDLGWAGTIQSLLQQVLRDEGVPVETLGLYLLTHLGAVERVMSGVDIDGYLASGGNPHGPVTAFMRSPEILEQTCMPDHGSQTGIDADLSPLISGPGVDDLLPQSIERTTVQRGVFAFQREWARYAAMLPGRLPSLAAGPQELLLGSLVRSAVSPTAEEARVFGTWVHDENFGSTGYDRIVGSSISRAVRHLDPVGLTELPMSELYWPYGLAELHDEHLATAATLVATGKHPWQVFASSVEVGDVEVFLDSGYGFSEGAKVATPARRNRHGLSFAGVTARGEQVRRIRIDPANSPCVIRIDWLSLSCWPRGGTEPVELLWDTPEALGRLSVEGGSWLRPKLLLVDTDDPQLVVDVATLIGREVYEVRVEMAYAVLATTGPEEPRAVRVRAGMRRRLRRPAQLVRKVEARTGLPLEAAARKAFRAAPSRGVSSG
jgi:hypothetical protein